LRKMDKSRLLEIFDRVKSQYSGFLTAVLWKLTGERELFEEALQIGLMKIWQNVEKLHNNEKAAAYIYRIALSANSQAWRQRIGRNGQISLERFQNEPAAEHKIQDSDTTEKIRRAIAKLPAKQGRAIVMRYLEQRDYSDIARTLFCSEETARSNVSKAIAALKKKLGSLSEQEH